MLTPVLARTGAHYVFVLALVVLERAVSVLGHVGLARVVRVCVDRTLDVSVTYVREWLCPCVCMRLCLFVCHVCAHVCVMGVLQCLCVSLCLWVSCGCTSVFVSPCECVCLCLSVCVMCVCVSVNLPSRNYSCFFVS